MPKDHSKFFVCVYIKYICKLFGSFFVVVFVLVNIFKQQLFITMDKPMFLEFHHFEQYKKSFNLN